uniref:signal-recognition-particle GTPase n=1 Tax=Dunaliella tertiolecta TaxID=3047 RepID=A0A7S3VP79_DUNTE|mmetsp:Transcript_26034/g.70505  ORF Transcript_26034/g.70505 Transcript_26034/m.70505 type:complete len:524 (+) Transcript_26034:77-1648(+)|eukprot:CAMPEP_0202351620 /NCGR_PEP_ID=MMETSP1126-20121109/8180_1 /ASSEMBLY_ACC=CAM_ASM_000457 /TAXON_ID=3047 /ORGANISM="Dunaliella tertiolecta, Strain CCMP1320" /LENGTH=523 /DNA_ID=CAMNT_0048943749 /DNA_START=32 /DNA_END=1603 /DNA_ORIENTATION=-
MLLPSKHVLRASSFSKPARACAPRPPARGRLVIRSAMFDKLSRSVEKAWKMVSKDGKLTPENIKEPLKEIRRALLEADVSLPVVRRFVKKVEEKALGQEVIVGVTPDMAFIKTVNDELVELMGSKGAKDLEQGFPQVILMAGLQGVGKTTACGKLALLLTKQKKKVLMVATDVYRPAAIDQLQKLGKGINVPVFDMGTSASPVEIARAGIAEAKRLKVDAVIVDTAGRLQIDDDMMKELKDTKAAIKPTDTLLVVDAMTGQEAANLVKAFNDQADITGAILTKMDGDSRGGAALSVREVSGKPIKFVGVGEKMDSLEPFYPERMASRILGQGDVLSLYEKAEQAIKAEDAEATMKRLMANKFDFNDFLTQFKTMNNMGGAQIMKLMPGMSKISEKQLYQMEKELKSYESMINVMQEEERASPDILAKSAARRRRIAQASGRTEAEVSNLMAKFAAVRAQVSKMGKMMQLGSPGGAQNEQLMKELLESSQRKVAPGKARVKREKAPAPPKTKGFGFGAAAGSKK